MKRKIFAMFITVCMLCGFAAVPVNAQLSGTIGEGVSWTYDEVTGDLEISGAGCIGDNGWGSCLWSGFRNQIKSVNIQNGVSFGYDFTSLEIFQACTSLESVTLPNSITFIPDFAFCNCTSLKNITIPSSITEIGCAAFESCTGLESVTLPNSITFIPDDAFNYCTSLKNITIPSSVTKIGNSAFDNCTSLKNITIPSSVTEIGSMAFENCTNLENITIPSSITEIGFYTFSGCTSLESVTIPKSVKQIEEKAFESCTSLATVNYSGSSEEWRKIKIVSNGNHYLLNASREYGNEPSSVTIVKSESTEDSIKFISNTFINNNDTVVKYGTLIIPLWLFNTSSQPGKVEYLASENPIESGYTFGATLTDIPDGYSDVYFVAKSYMILDDNTCIWSKAKKVSIDQPTLRKVAE